jgi:hypothetical protein
MRIDDVKHLGRRRFVLVAAVVGIVPLLGVAAYMERARGPLDPFADGMHAVIGNDLQEAVRVVDATGTYHFSLRPGEDRTIVAPDYSRSEDVLTISRDARPPGCLMVEFQRDGLVTVTTSQARSC